MIVDLDQDQIDIAAKWMYGVDNNCTSVLDHPSHVLRWGNVSANDKRRYTKLAMAVAPHVQMLWQQPSEDEVLRICELGNPTESVRLAVMRFVLLRNSRLRPDPRLEKLRDYLIGTFPITNAKLDEVVESIMKLVDN